MNLHETAMGQRFFNAQLPALIDTLKDIAAALPALHHLLYPFRQTHAFSLRSITANMKQMCSSPINASHLLTRQYNRKKKLCFRYSPARRPSLLNSIRLRYNAAILLYWSRHTPLVTVPLCRCLRQA